MKDRTHIVDSAPQVQAVSPRFPLVGFSDAGAPIIHADPMAAFCKTAVGCGTVTLVQAVDRHRRAELQAVLAAPNGATLRVVWTDTAYPDGAELAGTPYGVQPGEQIVVTGTVQVEDDGSLYLLAASIPAWTGQDQDAAGSVSL